MKTFLVINPKSANGVTGRRWAELSAQVAQALGPFGHAFTEGPMHAVQLTREALRQGYRCVAAVGGDGTINEVVNGFFQDGQPVAPGAALGVLPRGTGGDFRRTFDWCNGIAAALERLKGEETRPLDVGELEFVSHEGRTQRRYFVNICSFGASGLVDQEVNRASKAFGGMASFYIGTVRALLKYRDHKVRLRLDDGPAEDVDVTTLAVANGRYFGGGMLVAPDADPADGVFDVTLWSGYTLADFALKRKGVYSGAHVNWAGTRRMRCRTLVAETDGEVLLDVDGEQPGRLPCRITVLPGALRLKG